MILEKMAVYYIYLISGELITEVNRKSEIGTD
jgi:hypothetical protein